MARSRAVPLTGHADFMWASVVGRGHSVVGVACLPSPGVYYMHVCVLCRVLYLSLRECLAAIGVSDSNAPERASDRRSQSGL